MSENAFLTYKGKPLVRNGDTIYYGNMSDEFVIMLEIKSKQTSGGMEIAEKVSVSLMSTDPNAKEKVTKKSEKVGLYNAMDIGAIWLERALNPKK